MISDVAINVQARKLLWGRAGNRCAWAGCDQRLTVGAGDEETGILQTQGVVLGEEAHIRSSKADGPRYDLNYSEELLDTYENLILLCPTHHTVIDKDGGAGWPVDDVVRMKREHEREVDEARSPVDQRRQVREERLVAQLSAWERRLGIDQVSDWEQLTFGLNSPIPVIRHERFERLIGLGQWLLTRAWPPELPRLKVAFDHHFAVVQVLDRVLGEVMSRNKSVWQLDRLYKLLTRWDTAEYERQLRETNVRITSVQYLTFELARSANLVIRAAREELDPLYRLDEGVLLTRYGDGILIHEIVREEYPDWDWDSPPQFPTYDEIRKAIAEVAETKDARLEGVNPRTLTPRTSSR